MNMRHLNLTYNLLSSKPPVEFVIRIERQAAYSSPALGDTFNALNVSADG
jgi:hypothetical protein